MLDVLASIPAGAHASASFMLVPYDEQISAFLGRAISPHAVLT